MEKIKILNLEDEILINKYPDECPFCHKSIIPKFLTGIYINPLLHTPIIETIFQCPSNECNEIFISYYFKPDRVYGSSNQFHYYQTMFGNLKQNVFSKTIETVSKDYCKIFEEAFSAEQFGLKQICGVGYRKSLEFLIKDYLINVRKKDEMKLNLNF